MSMIDCKINVERKEDPKGDRVLLTFEYVVPYSHPFKCSHFLPSGKFLPYARW